jgi:hypothetical protein
VQHWGDSSKQPRISNAAYRRIYYYLTADERCGDLMHALIDSDQTLRHVEIGARSGPARPFGATAAPARWSRRAGCRRTGLRPVRHRLGPAGRGLDDRVERTGDPRWRDRIVAGMQSPPLCPANGLQGGAPFDLATGRFVGEGDREHEPSERVFGVFETMAELLELVDVPAYREAWLDYCAIIMPRPTCSARRPAIRQGPGPGPGPFALIPLMPSSSAATLLWPVEPGRSFRAGDRATRDQGQGRGARVRSCRC